MGKKMPLILVGSCVNIENNAGIWRSRVGFPGVGGWAEGGGPQVGVGEAVVLCKGVNASLVQGPSMEGFLALSPQPVWPWWRKETPGCNCHQG